MAIEVRQQPSNQAPIIAPGERQTRLFTVDDYYRMAEVGILKPDEKVELIEGVIYKLSHLNSRHAGCVKALNKLLNHLIGNKALLSIHNPIYIDQYSEPEPDVALLKARDDFYRDSHPTSPDIFLLIEVSDSTIGADRRGKVPLYAQAEIAVLWIVDIQKEAIEVYSNPSEGQYARFERVGRGHSLEVPGFPGAMLRVDDILG
jgi:Uma2 family endonuclease